MAQALATSGPHSTARGDARVSRCAARSVVDGRGWMRLSFLGVRGSTPEPDPACTRYGGHTSCVAVSATPDLEPNLVLDAGTGIRLLAPLLPDGVFRGTVVVTHMHWDHMHGLPFSAPLNQPTCEVDLRVPSESSSAEETLRRAMSPPVFPIGPEGLIGRWTFTDVPGHVAADVGTLKVRTADVAHKGARTVLVRVDSPTASAVYLPDHVPFAGIGDEALALMTDVDVLIHDGQFLPAEAALAHDYGHATTDEAIEVAMRCGARSLVLTHHAPGRTDDALDALARDLRSSPLPVTLAHQGLVLDVDAVRVGT